MACHRKGLKKPQTNRAHTKKPNKKLSGVIFYLMQIIPFKQFLAWDAKDEAFFAEEESSVTLHVLRTSVKYFVVNERIC